MKRVYIIEIAEVGLNYREARQVWGSQYVVSFVSIVHSPEVIIA
jgi:hypothetical protein